MTRNSKNAAENRLFANKIRLVLHENSSKNVETSAEKTSSPTPFLSFQMITIDLFCERKRRKMRRNRAEKVDVLRSFSPKFRNSANFDANQFINESSDKTMIISAKKQDFQWTILWNSNKQQVERAENETNRQIVRKCNRGDERLSGTHRLRV